MGLLSQITALERLSDREPVLRWAHYLIAALFFMIELLPVLVKVLTGFGGPSLYEKAEKMRGQIALDRCRLAPSVSAPTSSLTRPTAFRRSRPDGRLERGAAAVPPEPRAPGAHRPHGRPVLGEEGGGAWSLPKGEFDPATEGALDAAHREFREELGIEPPETEWAELGTFAYSSGKKVVVFCGDGAGFTASGDDFVFGEFEMEWPPRSGRTASFPRSTAPSGWAWMPRATRS